jgi:hypothetical protein
MNKYDKFCNFSLPISVLNKKIYDKFVPMFAEHKDYFVDNANISSVYGSPNCYWNGGRILFRPTHLDQMNDLRLFLEKYNIAFRFTFSNNKLLECHLQDYYCNKLLELFCNGKHEIIVNSQLLENYIRNKYGNKFKFISSTTKVLINPDEQKKEIDKNYYLVVLDYRYNTNINFLEGIEHKNKCEILVNCVCDPNCKRRKEHYDLLSLIQINQGYPKEMIECENESYSLYDSFKYPTFIKAEQIDKYINIGYTNFKIEGRKFLPLNLIETLLYYLIKDEYKMLVRNELTKVI